MIAADTSSWIAYLQGERGPDTELLDRTLANKLLVMVPVVLVELLSDSTRQELLQKTFTALPLLELRPGYWERAGRLRATVLAQRRKARLGDALIAQMCIDHSTPLITRDRDFRALAQSAKLDIIAAA